MQLGAAWRRQIRLSRSSFCKTGSCGRRSFPSPPSPFVQLLAESLQCRVRCVVIGCLLIDLVMLIDSHRNMIASFASPATRGFLSPLLPLPLPLPLPPSLPHIKECLGNFNCPQNALKCNKIVHTAQVACVVHYRTHVWNFSAKLPRQSLHVPLFCHPKFIYYKKRQTLITLSKSHYYDAILKFSQVPTATNSAECFCVDVKKW